MLGRLQCVVDNDNNYNYNSNIEQIGNNNIYMQQQ